MPLPAYSNKLTPQGTSFADKYSARGNSFTEKFGPVPPKWSDVIGVTWNALSAVDWADLTRTLELDKYFP